MRPAMLGRNVFLTKSDELQGRFRIEDSEVLFWKSINLSRCTYVFLVEGVGSMPVPWPYITACV